MHPFRIYLGKSILLLGGVLMLAGISSSAWHFNLISQQIYTPWKYLLSSQIIHWTIWLLALPLIFWLVRKFPLRRTPRSLLGILIHTPISLVFPAVLYGIYLLINDAYYSVLAVLFWNEEFVLERFAPLWRIYMYLEGSGFKYACGELCHQFYHFYALEGGLLLGCFTYWTIVAIAYARSYYQRYQAEEVKNLQLKSQLAQAQLQALKMQLHPHFFFNTLNSISSLLHSDVKAADQMLARLGELLRLTLDHSEQDCVTLEEEIRFLQCYLAIEQVRFADRLTVNMNIEPQALSQSVPNLILQPLIENAIKHGISQTIRPGKIHIEAHCDKESLHIQIQDSGPGLPANMTEDRLFSKGIGLSNTKDRLEQLYDGKSQFQCVNAPQGGFLAKLQIPCAQPI